MKFTPSSQPTNQGPADWFTGTVFIDGVRNPDEQSAIAASTFGSRREHALPGTTTPRGRPSTSPTGSVWSPRAAGTQEIRPGDVVYIEPGEEHWHGATPTRFMSHVAMQEADDNGEVVTWLGHVTDDEYQASIGDICT